MLYLKIMLKMNKDELSPDMFCLLFVAVMSARNASQRPASIAASSWLSLLSESYQQSRKGLSMTLQGLFRDRKHISRTN